MVMVDRSAPGWGHEFARRVTEALDVVRGFQLPVYGKGGLPKAAPAGRLIFVPDDVGGPVVAFSDGAAWRRLTDRMPVT